MAFINTPNVARCAIRYTLFGQDIVNTLWFRNTVDNSQDPVVIADLALDLANWAEANLLPELSEDISIQDVTATSQDTSTSPSVLQPISGVGGLAGASLPSTVCFTIKFNTAQRGRSGRGRNYIGGLRESDVAGNTFSSTRATAITAVYNTLISAPFGNWEWVVVSFWEDLVERSQGFAQTVTVCTFANLFIDTQRRRNTGYGT